VIIKSGIADIIGKYFPSFFVFIIWLIYMFYYFIYDRSKNIVYTADLIVEENQLYIPTIMSVLFDYFIPVLKLCITVCIIFIAMRVSKDYKEKSYFLR